MENIFKPEWPAWLQDSTIGLVIHGSQAYGTATPESDTDYRGICVPPRDYYTGLLNFEQAESKSPDVTIFELRKFMRLAMACNPNVLEILFVPDDCIVKTTEKFELLRSHRQKFLTKRARETYAGYAYGQMKRIKSHRGWLLDPPKKKPERSDFLLPELSLISADVIGSIKSMEDSGKPLETLYSADVLQVYFRERQYQNAKLKWDQYQNHQKTRNPVRAKMEQESGFNRKHGMHLVRLMRTCKEILRDGELLVRRPDAEELLSIRNGAWTYEELETWFESALTEIRELEAKTKLPANPDFNFMNKLCMELVG